MNTDRNASRKKSVKPSNSLAKVFEQTGQIKTLVDESVSELSGVNTVLKQDRVARHSPPEVEEAIERSAAVEDKVEEVGEKLSVVKQALQDEVASRQVLEHQFTAISAKEKAASHAAFHDGLTKLPNRALFVDRLEHGIEQAKRHGWLLAVMFIDLGKFKTINDTYGHDAGDAVLKKIAGRLMKSTRSSDTVSRHGGDEFMYLLTEITDESSVAAIAEKLRKSIQAPCNISVRDLKISPSVTASIGIAIYPQDGTTVDALVSSADQAMYRAKHNKNG